MHKIANVSVLLLGLLAFACKPSNPVIKPTDGRPNPKKTSIIELCEDVQQKWDKNGEVSRIYIVAHRANTKASMDQGIPDNSIPNIRKAIELGVDMVELDVRTTKDGQLVLMHNATIDATTEGSGAVSSLTLAEIKSHRMTKGGKVYRDSKGEYTYVPTLKEALMETKDKIYVNLDLASKNNDPKKIMQVIMEVGVEDQVMLFGVNAMEYTSIYPLIAIHPFIHNPKDVLDYQTVIGAKLFQYGNDIYLENKIPAFGVRVHEFDCLSYSNLLDDYDKQLLNGDYSPLEKFIMSGSDFVQTDVYELVDEYLKKEKLR